MAEVRFQIDDGWIDGLRRKIGVGSNTEVAREALTLLNWAADERRHGRVILSADPEMKNQLVRLAMPVLDRITTMDPAA